MAVTVRIKIGAATCCDRVKISWKTGKAEIAQMWDICPPLSVERGRSRRSRLSADFLRCKTVLNKISIPRVWDRWAGRDQKKGLNVNQESMSDDVILNYLDYWRSEIKIFACNSPIQSHCPYKEATKATQKPPTQPKAISETLRNTHISCLI